MNPEEMLDTLKSRVSARAQRSLDSIYEVCREQAERGEFDFSIATISRLGSKRGVPKAQSIRNKTGEHYQALIHSFVECYPGKDVHKPRRADSWIEEINDPKLRLLVSIQASELADARKMIREMVPPNLEIYVDDRKSPLGEHRLTESERHALEYLQSDEFMSEWGFSPGPRGEVVDGEDNRIFKPGTLDAIRNALRYS